MNHVGRKCGCLEPSEQEWTWSSHLKSEHPGYWSLEGQVWVIRSSILHPLGFICSLYYCHFCSAGWKLSRHTAETPKAPAESRKTLFLGALYVGFFCGGQHSHERGCEWGRWCQGICVLHIKHKRTVQNKYRYILSGWFMCILHSCMGQGQGRCVHMHAHCMYRIRRCVLGSVIVRYCVNVTQSRILREDS